MKKICVFSDSHGYAGHMLRAIELEKPSMIIHLGDGESDLIHVRRRFPELPIESLQGNCDVYSTALLVLRLTVEGRRIYATHGHRFHVKSDPTFTELRLAALAADADILLFGHTHTPYKDRTMGMDILNPGSCGRGSVPTYGVLEIDGAGVTTAVREVLN